MNGYVYYGERQVCVLFFIIILFAIVNSHNSVNPLMQSQIDPQIHEQPSRTLRAIKSQRVLPRHLHEGFQAQINSKFSQLRLLTTEKNKLITQLNTLKENAFSALQEKQEIIDGLKNQYIRHTYFEDQKEQMQKELNRYIRKVRQISEQKWQLKEKYEKQRVFFFQELYTKEAIIDKLSSRVAELQEELENTSDENKKLNGQLLENEENTEGLQLQIEKLKEQILEYYNRNQSHQKEGHRCYRCLQGQSVATTPLRRPSPPLDSKEDERNVEQIRAQYEEQIQNLVAFYENQIAIMKTMCQKQYTDTNTALRKTLQTQICSDYSENENQSVYDLFSHGRSQHSIHGLRSLKNLKNQLKLMKCEDQDGNEDENRSQFTNQFFAYQNKRYHKDKESLESSGNIHIKEYLEVKLKVNQQSEHNMQQEQKVKQKVPIWRISQKQLLWCLGGGAFGAMAALALHTMFRSPKK